VEITEQQASKIPAKWVVCSGGMPTHLVFESHLYVLLPGLKFQEPGEKSNIKSPASTWHPQCH